MERLDNSGSKVADRIAFLVGHHVTVRVTYAESSGIGGETFNAIYRDTLPMGREYFFVFEVSGKARLVRTTAVVEVIENGAAHD